MEGLPKTKEQLFGHVELFKATGTEIPNPVDLHEPFKHTESLIYVFCRGCSLLYEGDAVAYAEHKKSIQVGDTAPTAGVYVELGGCPSCDGDPKEVAFKEIPPLASVLDKESV